MPIAYCTECEWERRADDGETDDLDRAMIAHYVETGHSPIERTDGDLEAHADVFDSRDESERRFGTARVEFESASGSELKPGSGRESASESESESE